MLRADRRITHGMKKHPLYMTWNLMRQRCHNPDHPRYGDWGGRGIMVCDEWRGGPVEFIAYVERELGPRPLGCSLDRVDNDGNYEPGNLRWASVAEQNRNQRRRRDSGVSGYIGVYMHPVGRRRKRPCWEARYCGRYIGVFASAESAALARDVAALNDPGAQARLNLPLAS